MADLPQRRFEITQKCCERAQRGELARNQHIIGQGVPLTRHDLCGGGPQPALGAVAHHRIPYFTAGGKADPRALGSRANRPRRRLQNEPRGNRLLPARRNPQKLRPDFQRRQSAGSARCRFGEQGAKRAQADSRLRPFARRAASTRRPATVDMRARKPCRRLRTSLLGW